MLTLLAVPDLHRTSRDARAASHSRPLLDHVIFLAACLAVLAVVFGGTAHQGAQASGLPIRLSVQAPSGAETQIRVSPHPAGAAHHHMREDAAPSSDRRLRTVRRFSGSRRWQGAGVYSSWLMSWFTLRHLRGSPAALRRSSCVARSARRHILLCIQRV